MDSSTHSSRGVRFARALALITAMSTRVNGCYPLGYEGDCVCSVDASGGGDAARLMSRSGRCSPFEVDAGCRNEDQPAGPLAPPELEPNERSAGPLLSTLDA